MTHSEASLHGLRRQSTHVICICRGIGFPFGMAQTQRIRMIGKAATSQGLKFTVFHIGGSPSGLNQQVTGTFEGIAYDYFPATLSRPANPVLRKATCLYGVLCIIKRLSQIRSKDNQVCIYAWLGRGMFGIACKSLLRLFRLPVVQEYNEWWPGRLEWVKGVVNLALTQGTLAISRTIEDRLEGICSGFSISNKIMRVPVLADVDIFGHPLDGAKKMPEQPYLLWCGNADAYMRDIQFMLQALKLALGTGGRCSLILAGSKSDNAEEAVKRHVDSLGLPREAVRMTGYVDDKELRRLMGAAQALLLPLWDDDRSRCRFPNKLGEYLSSERPVITCGIGDLGEFLTDGCTAHLCRPGDASEFAERIRAVLADPAEAGRIGKRGREQALQFLDWRSSAFRISRYFTTISAGRKYSSLET
ncbi:glycosyltransferase family 4 protein [Geotalea sp. SG265]|uniref:glycosyltransferase family 4 protein n=1 Tax=Geotalea sp. SG265 TaxID=2922867 RepID=UPI001FAFF19C|nr:glycosyltransferase family 4 protein [Geotalea sp. SG265]